METTHQTRLYELSPLPAILANLNNNMDLKVEVFISFKTIWSYQKEMGLAGTCRVCLCGRRRLHAISNTLLQEIWEKLTNATFSTNDGKPLLVCYICCAQLRRSHQLRKRALEADKLLTAIVNSGSEQSQDALLLIASQTFGFDYKYVIEHQYNGDCTQFLKNTVEEIKQENEEHNKEWTVVKIKEEKEDSSQEDNLDNANVESDTPSEDDTPLKQILERENRIVLERSDIGASARKRTIIETPQNTMQMKLDETTKDKNPLINADLENLQKNTSKASYKSFPKKASETNVKFSKNKQNIKSLLVKCQQVNNISPEVNIVPKHKTRVKNVIAQDSETPTSKVIWNNAKNEIFKQCLPKSADVFTNSGLKRRLLAHTEQKPYFCDLCDYISIRRGFLERHMKCKHINEKIFSCHLCQYKCVAKSKLNIHLRTHTGEKPYNCNLCDYRCSHKNSLIRHIKCKHTNERNFSCHLCQYKCVTKSKLIEHIRKHTGEKPYKCDFCDYKSSQRSNINKHIILKHGK